MLSSGRDVIYQYGRERQVDIRFAIQKRYVEKGCRNDPNGGFFTHYLSVPQNGYSYVAEWRENVDPNRGFRTINSGRYLVVYREGGRELSRVRCIGSIIDNIPQADVTDSMIGDCE